MDRIEILGNQQDLDALYSSLCSIVGDEGEHGAEGHRLLVLSLCTDLRHAIQGDPEVELKDSGFESNKMRSTVNDVSEDTSGYTRPCTISYPEVLFVTMFLNDFIRDYARKKAVGCRLPLLDEINLWDADIAYVRLFQSLVVNCLEEVVTEASFKRILNLMSKGLPKD